MENYLVGVFGSVPAEKTAFEDAVGKKNETAGIVIYQRSEGSKRISLLDDVQFPERIQGYSRIASIVDHAYFVYPSERGISASDGELAILIDAFKLDGTIEILGSGVASESVRAKLKGLRLAEYPIEERQPKSSILDTSTVRDSDSFSPSDTLVYIDRAFIVKGVGLVVLGFILSGTVKLHDKLRLIPSESKKEAEVKGIQLNDEDQESAGRGVRVGLSLKGVELKDLEKVSWLDDSSFSLTDKIRFEFEKGKFYKQDVIDRDLHLQCPGELVLSKITKTGDNTLEAKLSSEVPVWAGMRVGVIDLNNKLLRIAGSGKALV